MDDRPIRILQDIVAAHGRSVVENTRQLEGLLNDYLRGDCRGEVHLLVAAVREGIPAALAGSGGVTPFPLLAARLAKKMEDNLYTGSDAARWAVEAWAETLGVLPGGRSPETTAAGKSPGRGDNGSGGFVVVEEEVVGSLVVKSDAECELWIDGTRAASLVEGKRLKVRLPEGRHQVAGVTGNRRIEKEVRILENEECPLALEFENKGAGSKTGQVVNGPSAGQAWRDPAAGVELLWIPPGDFTMGSPEGEAGRFGNEVQHRVTLSRGFWLGKYPVTQGQWEAVMGSNPSSFQKAGKDAPVEQLSWDDCQEFLRKLNAKAGHELYRLPTEAEWEYACRAGTAGDRYGEEDAIAWYDGNSGGTTHPVGRKRPNAWGLHDMLGNVWEWCSDWYGDYPSGSVTDPRGPSSGSIRVDRGGSWGDHASDCRSALRGGFTPGFRNNYLGFRLARGQ